MNCCQPIDADIVIEAGTNSPVVGWQFLVSDNPDVLFPITGSTFKLAVMWRSSRIDHDSAAEPTVLVVDEPTSTVTWHYTVAESRLIPVGRIARYEIERRLGTTQSVFVRGSVIIEGGINPD